MKTNKMLISFILFLFIMVYYMQLSGSFILGGYVYNRNTNTASYHDSLSVLMQQCGFNAGVCDAMYNSNSDSVNTMLSVMHNHGIDGILEDYIFEPSANILGARTLSMGNYFRFEAEYYNSESCSQFDLLKPDNYFYMSSNSDSVRIGYRDDDNAFSNNNCWIVDNNQIGYAYNDLTYKWPKQNSSEYYRVGQEFRFPYNGIKNNNQGNPDYDLFNNIWFYVTYGLKVDYIDSLADNTILANVKLTCKGKTTNDSTTYVIRNYNVTHPAFPDTVSYITKADYLNSPTDIDFQNVHRITVGFKLSWLGVDSLVVVDANQWDKMLLNVNPTLYWNGQGSLQLDYIDFEDTIHKDYIRNTASLAQIRKPNVPYLYGLDEPVQGQFDSFYTITRYLESNPANPDFIATVHQFNKEVTKPGQGGKYRHRKAFFDTVIPNTLVIDEYPFFHCNPDWINPGSDAFAQLYIDNVCTEYDYYKRLCGADTKFITVPQTYGRWKPLENSWYYLLPPEQVAASLQFLPLCYQADGILDYEFISRDVNAFSLVKEETDHSIHTTSLYNVIKNANQKVQVYGPILTADEIEWIGSDIVMPDSDSPYLSSVWLDSLYVPYIANSPLYQGYVQAGYYTDLSFTHPYLMLVNRRAITTQNNLREITPFSTPPLALYNSSYSAAPTQTVRLTPSSDAHAFFGNYLAYFDPYDSTLYRQNTTPTDSIEVSIDPGDGKLLQMVGSLPDNVPAGTMLIRDLGVIQGSIALSQGAQCYFCRDI